jgi:hypothetical protein
MQKYYISKPGCCARNIPMEGVDRLSDPLRESILEGGRNPFLKKD